MQTQMFPWKRKDMKTGEEFITMTQGAYRDAGFCKEFVFPEECLKEVLSMLGVNSESCGSDYGISGLRKSALRKILGNGVIKIPKEIPEPEWKTGIFKMEGEKIMATPYRFVEHTGVMIHIIGIKKDKREILLEVADKEKYPNGIYQEMM